MKKIILLLCITTFFGCSKLKHVLQPSETQTDKLKTKEITTEFGKPWLDVETKEILEKVGEVTPEIMELIEKPLHKFTPHEIDTYLKFLHASEPNLRKRIDHIAKKFLTQEYEIYLLGEFPFEIFDPQPLFSIDKSDCVVFSEHVYAMALSDNWKNFFAMLQRIRYKDGVIGLLTRNHFTEADWVVNDSWLIKDITDSLPGVESKRVKTKIDRAKFFSKWNLGQDIPVQELNWSYIPTSQVEKVLDYLKTGDFVNVVRGYTPDDVYVGHVGIISVDDDGTVYLIHSTTPEVKIERLIDYMYRSMEINKEREEENKKIIEMNKKILSENQKLRSENNGKTHSDEKKLIPLKPYFYGFRFFELQENAIENLQRIDGPKAPKITIYGNE